MGLMDNYSGSSLSVGGANVGVTPQNIQSSPAYQFRFSQGLEALQRSAASRGTLLTGGTLKDLTAFGQGLASTEYDNEWQRQFGLAGLNADISSGNANRTLGGLTSLSSMGLNAASGMGNLYAGYGAAGAGGTYGATNAWNQGMTDVGNSLGEWLRNRRGTSPTAPSNQTLPGAWINPWNINPNVNWNTGQSGG